MLDKIKEFKPSSWAIDNKITIYLITIFITLAGIMAYNSLPKEQFPDITVPTIFISTVNGGNSPTNIENTITKQIEKRLKAVSGVKKFTSTSMQDVSVIVVEFRTTEEVAVAKQKVKDAVEIQVNIDAYKLQAAGLTLNDISRAIASENLTMSGGNISMNGMKPTLSFKGEYKDPKEIEDIIVSSQTGAKLFVRDFAEVVDGFKEQESY